MKKLPVIAAFALLGILLCTAAVAAIDIVITASPDYAGVPIVTASDATNVTSTSAVLHGDIAYTGGTNSTVRGFEWGYSTGNYTHSWNETGDYGAGEFEHEVSGLTSQVQVFWRAFAVNAYGQGNSTELTLFTNALPGPPTDFTITGIGDTIASISWTMGEDADTTVIRGSSTGYPTAVTDGYPVYSGNETSVVVDSLSLNTAIYYYRAWSLNEYGYSTTYAQGYVGNPLGISAIIFVIGLCGFALWKTGWVRILLSICIIIWGVFAISYDIKIAAPLITMGTVLFVMAILKLHRGDEE